jgi:hypothetical protein
MFLRFVLPRLHADTGIEDGIFQVAYTLRDGGDVTAEERAELAALLRWFGDHLSTPKRFNRTTSKGFYRRAMKGISWIKPNAREHIAKLHRLAAILRDHGHHVRVMKSRRPGYIVYEDEFQIVVEPFADLRRR